MSRISSTRSTAAKRMVADLDPVSGTVRRGRCAAGRPAEPGLATAARRVLPSDYGATQALYRPLESDATQRSDPAFRGSPGMTSAGNARIDMAESRVAESSLAEPDIGRAACAERVC